MPFDLILKSDPPNPPVDGGRGRDERPHKKLPFLISDIRYCMQKTHEVWCDMYTIRYKVMLLWDSCYMSVTDKDCPEAVEKLKKSGLPLIRRAHVSSPAYKEWVELWHPKGKILPHIQWGGAVKAIPGGDGGAGYAAWKLYALSLT